MTPSPTPTWSVTPPRGSTSRTITAHGPRRCATVTCSTPTLCESGGSAGPGASPPRARPGLVIGGRYRLISHLGEGGVGEVWEAEHIETGRRMAVKLMLPTKSTERLARFVREGRLSLALRHPHIVEVEEVGGDDDGVPFMAMELLPGPSLESLVERRGPLPWARVQPLLVQLCDALAHAHAHGVVHHDIKPSNIMLASASDLPNRAGQSGQPDQPDQPDQPGQPDQAGQDGLPGQPDHCKLVDFGIARRDFVDEPNVELTSQGQLLGSPGYMSPEQIRGKRCNPRSDQYGLACTAFYLLTGRDPIEARSVQAQVYATLYGKLPALVGIDASPAQTQAIEAVLHRAMAKDPADRFTSASDMAEAIAAIGAES